MVWPFQSVQIYFARCYLKLEPLILNEKTRECRYRPIIIILVTLSGVVFDPHPVSCLEGQHRQFGPCFEVVITTTTICECVLYTCKIDNKKLHSQKSKYLFKCIISIYRPNHFQSLHILFSDIVPKGRHSKKYSTLNKKTWECCYRTVIIITCTRPVFDPNPVSCLKGQHRQVGSCIVTCVGHGTDLYCSIQHNVHMNIITISLGIDKEDVYPRPGSSEYPVTRVVSVAYVCDDLGEYQGTAAPGTAGWRNTGCECYPSGHIYKNNWIIIKISIPLCDSFISIQCHIIWGFFLMNYLEFHAKKILLSNRYRICSNETD